VKSWRDLIRHQHECYHADDEFDLVLRPGASSGAVEAAERELGIPFPDELRSLYHEVDGFGLTVDGEKVNWAIHPLGQLPSFVARIREWIGETHPEVAARFFPFFDWSNGDAIGYFLSLKKKWYKNLYWFQHELFQFDRFQMQTDFMIRWDRSIKKLLSVD
jgi:hypothetical protein